MNKLERLSKWLQISLLIFLPVILMSFFYVDRIRFLGLISLYGILSIGRIVFQVVTSNLVRRRQYDLAFPPPATLVVTAYNEPPDIFERGLKSFVEQDYPKLEIIVVDDGSSNHAMIRNICLKYGVRYLYQANAGKRHALYKGFNNTRPASEVILVADSDTIWRPNAARSLVAILASNPKIGAATGYVAISNATDSFLTRLIDQRYYMAFNQERASQSMFGAVTCVSGPLGAYRRDVIDRIKKKFVSQRFLGKVCTFGDDRHLTNLVFLEGLQVEYAASAIAYTQAPVTLPEYLVQQTRWGKSHWREMLWQFKALPLQSLFLSYDWIVSLLLPFLLALSVAHYLVIAHGGHPFFLLLLLGSMILMGLIRVIDPIRQTRNPAFLLFVFYGLFHLVFLMPVKFYALASVRKTGWGTR